MDRKLQNSVDVALKPEVDVTKPSFYQVLLLNDDFTPMDFVVTVLKSLFNKSHEDAISLMLQIHNKGEAKCGIYTREIAETKVIQVIEFARKNNHPLKCVMKKD